MQTFGTISAIAAPLLAAALTWVLSRRKSAAEVRKMTAEAVAVEIQNAGNVILFWKKTAEDLTEKLHQASMKIDELMDRLQSSIDENEKLEKKIGELEKQLHS